MIGFTSSMAVCGALATALTVASGCSARTTSPSTVPGSQPDVRRIVVLGDSLAVSPTREESFPAVLAARLAERGLPWTMANESVRGDVTGTGLLRARRVLQENLSVLVLALGANDGLRGIDLDTVERNLAGIIEAAQDRGIAVLVCGMEAPPLRGLTYSIGFHTIFLRLASTYNIPRVPFLLSGVVLNPDFNGSDGIHPNQAGARRIADNVWPYLEPMLVSMPLTARALDDGRPVGRE